MRICNEPTRGITCIYASSADGELRCPNNQCRYKEIDYKRLMEDKHIYNREHSRIKQRR